MRDRPVSVEASVALEIGSATSLAALRRPLMPCVPKPEPTRPAARKFNVCTLMGSAALVITVPALGAACAVD
jgi:hypothetical protein